MTGDITGTVGSVGGGIAGATIGTAIFPGVGTVTGAVIGSVGGDKLAREVGESAYDDLHYGTTGVGLYDDRKRQKNDDDYMASKIETEGALNDLAQALADKNLGSGLFGMNKDEWLLALANPYGDDGIFAEYDKIS